MKLKNKILALIALIAGATPVLTSCSDEPDEQYYYSFTGEMMSDYKGNSLNDIELLGKIHLLYVIEI